MGLRKRVIWDEPVGALSNLLAVMNSDVIAQPGLVPAQRLICTAFLDHWTRAVYPHFHKMELHSYKAEQCQVSHKPMNTPGRTTTGLPK